MGGGRGGVDKTELLKDLRKVVTSLENDLRARSEDPDEPHQAVLEGEYQRARDAKRTAATYGVWRDGRVTQVAAAWVLGTVFVRFCEDNGLIEDPWLSGPGERLAYAEERQGAFFHANPKVTACGSMGASVYVQRGRSGAVGAVRRPCSHAPLGSRPRRIG